MVHCHSHLQFTGFQNNEARKYEVISNLWPHRLNICANLWSWHSVGRQHLNTNKVSGTHLVFRLDCFFVAKEIRMVVQRLCHSSQLLHKGHLINVYTCLTNTVRTTTTEEVRDNITWPMCVCAVFTLKQGHLKAYCNRTFIWLNLWSMSSYYCSNQRHSHGGILFLSFTINIYFCEPFMKHPVIF